MKIKSGKETEYKEWYDKNNDSYGRGCFTYAESWANLMEQNLSKLTFDLIEQYSFDADTEGITGFMASAGKSILKQCWEYGILIEYHYEKDETKKVELEKVLKNFIREKKLERILDEN